MCLSADKSLPNYPTSRLCLCAPGTKTNVSFCGQDFLQQRDYDMKVNPYAAVVASDFCLEPPGDTPTRSHFYLVRMLFPGAVLSNNIHSFIRGPTRSVNIACSTSHNSIADPCIQAVFSGCIPVIFDHECSRKSKQGLDFSNMEVSGCPRNTVYE